MTVGNSAVTPRPRSFATPVPTVVALAGTGALAAGIAAGLLGHLDAPGRVLLALLAALLLGVAAHCALVRPVLTVSPSGLTIGGLGAGHLVPWAELVAVQARTTRRFVTTTRTVELDLGERLVVLPSYRLGRRPEDVVAAIERSRPDRSGSEGSGTQQDHDQFDR